MQTLYICRHGIAVPHGTPGVCEEDRPLTPSGEKRMKQIGRGLRKLDITPQRIATSPLPRALRTAEIVAKALGLEDEIDVTAALTADRTAAEIRAWLEARSEDELMIVGHNPSLSDLLSLLLTGRERPLLCELAKGGIAAVAMRTAGTAQLDWLARPRLLRR